MLALHTVLHPTDFSEHSDHALGLACALTRDYDARLVILHVAPVPAAILGEAVLLPESGDDQETRRLQLHRHWVPGDVPAERRFAEGDPATEILEVAREVEADLIVMGTHGRTGLGRLLLGSVAEQVLRRAGCPVLTVKEPRPEGVPADSTIGEAAPQVGGPE
jgi:nucleotide-binding universal stress UspA family protein